MYIARPTKELQWYLDTRGVVTGQEFDFGRLSMALEILTVVKTLEDELVPMLALQRAEMISVLETLLVDQGLDETANLWYEALGEWRTPKFIPIGYKTSDDDGHDEPASAGVTLRDALALAEGTRAQQDDGRSLDQALSESAQRLDEVEQATQIESDESPESSNPAELLEELRTRLGRRPLPNPPHSEPES